MPGGSTRSVLYFLLFLDRSGDIGEIYLFISLSLSSVPLLENGRRPTKICFSVGDAQQILHVQPVNVGELSKPLQVHRLCGVKWFNASVIGKVSSFLDAIRLASLQTVLLTHRRVNDEERTTVGD